MHLVLELRSKARCSEECLMTCRACRWLLRKKLSRVDKLSGFVPHTLRTEMKTPTQGLYSPVRWLRSREQAFSATTCRSLCCDLLREPPSQVGDRRSYLSVPLYRLCDVHYSCPSEDQVECVEPLTFFARCDRRRNVMVLHNHGAMLEQNDLIRCSRHGDHTTPTVVEKTSKTYMQPCECWDVPRTIDYAWTRL
jgi:hypothetical protein